MKNILIADLRKGAVRLERILRGKYSLCFAKTHDDVKPLLDCNKFDLIIIGLLFDDSKMFELMSELKRNACLKETPVMGFSDEPTYVSIKTRDSLEMSTHFNGFSDYVDTGRMSDEEILNRIESCLDENLGMGNINLAFEKPNRKRERQEHRRQDR